MTRISKSHPFVVDAFRAERLEQEAGRVTPEVLKIRKELKTAYPDLYAVYIHAKESRQTDQRERTRGKRSEERRAARIRGYSIGKSRMDKKGFGKDVR